MNGGLSLMIVMDLFPAGIHQLIVVMQDGYAAGRSQNFIQAGSFQLFTMLRGIGVTLFVVGGVFPLVWFMITRWFDLRPEQTAAEQFVVPRSVLAVTGVAGGGFGDGAALSDKEREEV